MTGRYDQATHPLVLNAFLTRVAIPLAKTHNLTCKVYECSPFDRVDFATHLDEAFSWHQDKHAYTYGGVRYSAAFDFNIYPAKVERGFVMDVLFPRLRGWGIPGRWEGGTHLHADAGGNETFGDSAALHTGGTHIGSPAWAEAGHPIAIDGQPGPNTIRKMQLAVGVPVDGDLGPTTIRAVQRRAGVRVTGSWDSATAAAVARRCGTKTPVYPSVAGWGLTALQMRLMHTTTL